MLFNVFHFLPFNGTKAIKTDKIMKDNLLDFFLSTLTAFGKNREIY
jgi:hypothetical protein